jgi:hypothetical protein
MASITPQPGWLGQAASAVGKQTPKIISSGAYDAKPDKSWWQHALTPILQGPIGKGLQAIDLGRSALVSTIKEGVDLVQGEGFSGSDWLEQTKNHYGFGTLLKDENVDLGKWGNRIAGFVGDVALDPITYMTFGSGALAKMGSKEVADQLMKAGFKNEATRVIKSGSKLAAGGKALRNIGYDVGLGFNIPGTGQMGRALRFDKALDAVTGGAIARRRAREWAPFFRQQMKAVGSTKSDEAMDALFNNAVRSGNRSAREIIDAEAKALVKDRAGMGMRAEGPFAGSIPQPLTQSPTGGFAVGRTGEAVPMRDFAEGVVDEISDDLLSTVRRAATSRSDITWRNGQASYQLGQNVGRRVGGGDNAIIRTLASKPGEGFQAILRSTAGQRLSKGLRRKGDLDKYLMSGNPVLYGFARAMETGDMIGFANKGKWLQAVDQLQHEMLTAAHKGGFDVADIKPGAVGEMVGQKPSAAQSARAAGSRLLYDAMDEPWQYVDEGGRLVDNTNLDAFKRHVEQFGDGTISAEEIHRSVRKFWDDVGEDWARITGRDIRDPAFLDEFSNEVFTTRTMSKEAREAAKREGWYKERIENGARLGEREATGPQTAVRDVAYTVKERVFVPGFEFRWGGTEAEPIGFIIAKPGTIVDGVQAPSVRKQIEDFVAKVDPRFREEGVNFFDSDVAKVIDKYKSSAGREMLWAGMEEHLVKMGILIDADDVNAFNRLLTEMQDNTKTMRATQKKTTAQANAKRARSQEATAKAKAAMGDEADLLEESAQVRQSIEGLDGLDPQIAAIQRTLMNLSDELQGSIAKTADGTFDTARQSMDAMEDLFEMAMGLEASTRLAQMLRTVGEGITAKGEMPFRVNRSFQDVLVQLKIAKDLLEQTKNYAAKLGGQDKAVREVEQLIDGLMGKSRMGMARKDAPKYIQNYVDQVHEIGRLADELEAGVIFNAGYRRPTNVFDIANRKWVKETEQKIRLQLEADSLAAKEGRKLQTEGSIFASFSDEGGNPLYGKIMSEEGKRLTRIEVRRERLDRVLELNQRAQAKMEEANRLRGYDPETAFPQGATAPEPMQGAYAGTTDNYPNMLKNEAEALDLQSQADVLEAKIQLDSDEFGEILEQDMNKFIEMENIFESIAKKQPWQNNNEDPVAALIAGIQDGLLPFGPVYAPKTIGGESGAEVLDMMRGLMNIGEKEVGSLFKAWDSLQGYFKAQAIARPSFVQRNGFGAMFMNILAGMDPMNHIKYAKMKERAIKAGWKDALAENGEVYKAVKNVDGLRQFHKTRPLGLKQRAARIGAEKLAKQGNREFRDLVKVYDSGAIGAGQAASEVAQSYRMSGATTLDQYGRPRRWNPARRDNVWNTAVRSGNAEMEDFVRGALAYDSIVNGMSEIDTVARVNKFHFNYSKENMTDLERGSLARAYPFYTWMRNSVPLMATQLVRNPRPFLRYLTLKRNIELGVEEDRNMPAWYGQRWGIDLGGLMGNPNQGARAFAFPDLPFMDLVEATQDPLKGIKSGLSPLIKAPIELTTGVEMFSGRSIKDEYVKPPIAFDVPGLLPFLETLPGSQVAKNRRGEYGIKESTLHGLGSFIPYLTLLRRMIPREKRYEDKALTAFIGAIAPIGYRTPKTVQRDRMGERTRRKIESQEDKARNKSLQRIR